MSRIELNEGELRVELAKETAREANKSEWELGVLANSIVIRKRAADDGPNWDADCGIVHPTITAAFVRAAITLKAKYNLAD
jgi:hypothetical protein